jgi:hypothetical protein
MFVAEIRKQLVLSTLLLLPVCLQAVPKRARSPEPTCELPECFLNATELISFNGYHPESHLCKTEDGYHLTLHRITNGSQAGNRASPTILLLHGLLDSSTTFLLNGREGSLGFLLAADGFDVWLGNSRGNRYSLSHDTLSPSHLAFWDWSWDELARSADVYLKYFLNLAYD